MTVEPTTEPSLVPTAPTAQLLQGEICPPTEFSAVLPAWKRAIEPDPILVQTTGVSSHLKQAELLDKRLVQAASIIARLNSVSAGHLAGKMLDCHTRQSWAQCSGCGKARTFFNHCDLFFCPICQPRLARDRARSIEWWSKQVSQPKHVVLTARNTDRLTNDRVKWFKAQITKLRRRKFARNWQSGTWSIEVTNEGRGWHLHAHLLVNAGWIDIPTLCTTWGELMGQAYAIVKVKAVRGDDYVKEVTKYAVKGSDLAKWSGDTLVEFIYAMRGQKLFGVFGKLHGLRTKLREFLDSIIDAHSRCECGCDIFRVYSHDEWQWKQFQSHATSTTRPNAPPILAQVDFYRPNPAEAFR